MEPRGFNSILLHDSMTEERVILFRTQPVGLNGFNSSVTGSLNCETFSEKNLGALLKFQKRKRKKIETNYKIPNMSGCLSIFDSCWRYKENPKPENE